MQGLRFDQDSLNQIPNAFFILDNLARVTDANQAAGEFIRHHDSFAISNRQIVCNIPHIHKTIHQSIQHSLTMENQHEKNQLLVFGKQDNLTHQIIFRIGRVKNQAESVKLILSIFSRQQRIMLDHKMLKKVFRLTPAEADLATDLINVTSIGQIALNRGLSVSTIKTHLKNLFKKTGTHSQTELLRLLISGLNIWKK